MKKFSATPKGMEKVNDTMRAGLLRRIEAHLEATGVGPSAFGRDCTGNSELVKRLREGGDVRTGTYEQVMAYLNDAASA